MAVIRLPDGRLFLHSPVEADAATRAAIDARLGDEADPCCAGAIEQVLLRGAPYMNEIAFFHRLSRAMRASIDRVTVGHGEVLERGVNAALAKAYAWQ